MNNIARKILICAAFFIIWEVFARFLNQPLLVPTFTRTMHALWSGIVDTSDSGLLTYIGETSKSLFTGFAIGTFIATLITILALNTRLGEEALSVITGAFAPLPAVAIFPLSLMFFGISYSSLVFIAAFATFFPVAVAMLQGFRSVSMTLRFVGRNFGMSNIALTCKILVPAALPSILSGLRNGFSNGFRALVAVEMVIGAATGKGGLGWYVMYNKQNLDIPEVYAGILAVMAVGLIFESVFRAIESRTINRWGMSN